MKLNVQRIDERIARLQELRRIALDPDMAAMFSEFVTADDQAAAATRQVAPELKAAAADAPAPAEPATVVEPVPVKVTEDPEAAQNGRSLWGINRR